VSSVRGRVFGLKLTHHLHYTSVTGKPAERWIGITDNKDSTGLDPAATLPSLLIFRPYLRQAFHISPAKLVERNLTLKIDSGIRPIKVWKISTIPLTSCSEWSWTKSFADISLVSCHNYSVYCDFLAAAISGASLLTSRSRVSWEPGSLGRKPFFWRWKTSVEGRCAGWR
jgi:hypothetical protein